MKQMHFAELEFDDFEKALKSLKWNKTAGFWRR